MRSLWWLVLLALVAPAACTIDEQLVADAYAAGLGTGIIGLALGCTQRRVQQILVALRDDGATGGSVPTQSLPQPATDELLVDMVAREIKRHGDYYGVQMLLGALRQWQPEYHFTRRAVATAAAVLRPEAFSARRDWATSRLERRHYHADHFCYSWHMDLTCKLAAYGIYLGFIIDGDTRMVIHSTVMSDKSAVRVYGELLRPALLHWGFPDQLVTDQGEEWRLCVFVCFFVWWEAGRATPTGRIPHKVVPSTANQRVERFNYEPNMRVLSWCRAFLNVLEAGGVHDPSNAIHVQAVQALLLPIIRHGVVLLALAWNQHRVKNIPHRPNSGGVPLRCMVERPHPGGQLTLTGAGVFNAPGDEAFAYHRHVGRELPPVAQFPDAEQQLHDCCHAAMQQYVGDISDAWERLIAQDYTSLVAGYLAYLQAAQAP